MVSAVAFRISHLSSESIFVLVSRAASPVVVGWGGQEAKLRGH